MGKVPSQRVYHSCSCAGPNADDVLGQAPSFFAASVSSCVKGAVEVTYEVDPSYGRREHSQADVYVLIFLLLHPPDRYTSFNERRMLFSFHLIMHLKMPC